MDGRAANLFHVAWFPLLLQERVQRVRALLPEAFALRQQTCSNLQDVFDVVTGLVQEGFFPVGRVVRDVQ